MKRKYYTRDEANSVLPEIKQMAGKIRQTEDLRVEKQKVYVEVMNAIAVNGGGFRIGHVSELQKSVERSTQRLQRLMGMLQEKFQCEIKGLHPLLVDFYTLRDGREAFLCWKEDETEISHWHDLDTGFAGRQPL